MSVCFCMHARAQTHTCTQTHTHIWCLLHWLICENYSNCIYDNIIECIRWRWNDKREKKIEEMETLWGGNGCKNCLAYSNHKYFDINFTEISKQFIFCFWSELTKLSNHFAHIVSIIHVNKIFLFKSLSFPLLLLLLLLFHK